ncbi:hypothetical protein OAX78_02755 [Planctomycetota bacterium]|nr:hypothetical protein [Planctomycetota bacterium]
MPLPSLDEELRLDPHVTPHRPDAPEFRRTLPTHRSVVLDLPSHRWASSFKRTSVVPQITAHEVMPPGSVHVRYQGLARYVVRHAQRRFRKEWRAQINERFDETNMTDREYRAEMRKVDLAFADHATGGRWWQRTWWDSLSETQGGAPSTPHVVTIGTQTEILRIGSFSISNDLRGRLDAVALLGHGEGPTVRDVPNERARASDHAHLARSGGDTDEPVQALDPPHDMAVVVGSDARSGYPGLTVQSRLGPDNSAAPWVRFKVRPSVRVKVSGLDVLTQARVRMDLEVFWGADREQVLDVECDLRYDLQSEELRATVQVALVSW